MERVLLIGNDRLTSMALCDHLRDAGFEVEATYSGAGAVAAIERQPPRCLVADLHNLQPGPTGLDAARLARSMRPDVQVVFISSGLDASLSAGIGASAFIAKPFHFDRVEEVLRAAPGSTAP